MSQEVINGVDFSSGLVAIIRTKTTEEGRVFAQAFVDALNKIPVKEYATA